MARACILLLVSALVLAACGGDNYRLNKFISDGTPEEFGIVPKEPLEIPDDIRAQSLPQPTPGQANRTDPQPLGNAVEVLGGNRAALNATGVPASDSALIAQAGRFGVAPNIRATLKAEDEAFLKRAKLFNVKLVRDDEYRKAYRRFILDAAAEILRFRRAGVRTPTVPPQQ
ncbi:DUF3035 domain-containing protein [Pseudaestuariivita atlantica]|uniref:Pyruvate/2-oxoglutarate dehydrogenase complex, dihydrolipoamide acyltransferase (E2) component n=1 Tax=Pseudaestuariivita atlantica TaxID=1317121 RepID=A0A0L1JTX9_9RHOB|nr:DUF3035 domain-containing protein [Pseudaestuariivita atlantica]KNG94863.1 hypothetical protein ATO11_05650 [Pseudaestuariivita atlantica]